MAWKDRPVTLAELRGIEEKMCQLEAVAVYCIRMKWYGYFGGSRKDQVSLKRIGMEEFGLTKGQCMVAISRARAFRAEQERIIHRLTSRNHTWRNKIIELAQANEAEEGRVRAAK